MTCQSLVYVPGDRIRGWGAVIQHDDGMWFGLQRTVNLAAFDGPPRRSPHSIRLMGLDRAAVPTTFQADGAIPGMVVVTGVWLGHALEVEHQGPARPSGIAAGDSRATWTVPPCPPPAGGWPHGMNGALDDNLDVDLGDLRSTGAAVTVVVFRPGADQAVLVVAATDRDAVEAVPAPKLPDRLRVVTQSPTIVALIGRRQVAPPASRVPHGVSGA